MHCHRFLNPRRSLLAVFISSFLVILLCAPFVPRARAVRDRQIVTEAAQAPSYRSGELLVRFRGGASEQQKSETASAYGARRKQQLRGESGVEKLELLSNQNPEALALQMLQDPAVEFAEPNFLIGDNQYPAANRLQNPGITPPLSHSFDATRSLLGQRFWSPNKLLSSAAPQAPGVQPNDPEFSSQWALSNTGQTGGQYGSDIEVTTAWQTTTGAQSTVIA